MKLMRTEDAVGHVLCHDITQIIKDEKKGPVFRKGHIIRPEDVPVLLSVGKDHIYIWENNENMLHEDEAAEILRDLCISENMRAILSSDYRINPGTDTVRFALKPNKVFLFRQDTEERLPFEAV